MGPYALPRTGRWVGAYGRHDDNAAEVKRSSGKSGKGIDQRVRWPHQRGWDATHPAPAQSVPASPTNTNDAQWNGHAVAGSESSARLAARSDAVREWRLRNNSA